MAFKPTVGYIADAFSTAFRQQKDQMQKEREFTQKMSEEQRQFGLLQQIRDQNAAIEKQRANDYSKYVDFQTTPVEKPISYKDTKQYILDKLDADKQLAKYKSQFDNPKGGTSKEFGGFKNYYKIRGGLLGNTATMEDPDNEGMFIDAPLTEGEIKTNRARLQSEAIAELPQRAQAFYANTASGKKMHPYEFYLGVEDAYKNGLLDDVDRDALLQLNVIRSDWGEYPDEIPETPPQTGTPQNAEQVDPEKALNDLRARYYATKIEKAHNPGTPKSLLDIASKSKQYKR